MLGLRPWAGRKEKEVGVAAWAGPRLFAGEREVCILMPRNISGLV